MDDRYIRTYILEPNIPGPKFRPRGTETEPRKDNRDPPTKISDREGLTDNPFFCSGTHQQRPNLNRGLDRPFPYLEKFQFGSLE